MADLLGLGISGLQTNKRALDVVSHNIANSNTEGYSRQRAEIVSRSATQTGAGYFGNGSTLSTVSRSYDEFVVENLRDNLSDSGELDTYYKLASQIDNILADSEAGLSPALQDFYEAIQGVADDPDSIAAREVLLSTGDSLVARFQLLDRRLEDIHDRVNREMESNITRINQISTSIADLNLEIVRSIGASGGNTPNDLLDERDTLVQELAGYVPVKTVEQTDGALNVFFGTGQPLVVASSASQLELQDSEYPTEPKDVVISGSNVNVTEQITGGSLGGALDFVDEILEPAKAEMGRIAMAMTIAFNDQNAKGKDLDGQMGGDFFKDISVVGALASTNNDSATDYGISATVDNVANLKTSDYEVEYVGGGNYQITRLSDSTLIAGPDTIANLDTSSEGFTLSEVVGTSITAGDSFLLRPAKTAAGDVSLWIDDPGDIAAAGAVITSEAAPQRRASLKQHPSRNS